jgi:outer membrane lipoprotein carrier protein
MDGFVRSAVSRVSWALVWMALLAVVVVAGRADATESEPQSVQEIVQAIEKTYANVQGIRADFTQTSRSSLMGEQHQKGRVLLKRPRKMRWVFTLPDDRQFVTDGQTMWIWSASDNQVIVTGDFASQSGDMPQLLDDLSKLDELFDIVVLPGPPQTHVLSLTPKKQAAFKKLELVLEKKKYTLEKVTMTDNMDGVVELAFSQVKLNPELADSSFTFAIPPGAQVIRSDGL